MLSFGWAVAHIFAPIGLIIAFLGSRLVNTLAGELISLTVAILSIVGLTFGLIYDVPSFLTEHEKYARYWFIGLLTTFVSIAVLYPYIKDILQYYGIEIAIIEKEAEQARKRRTITRF